MASDVSPQQPEAPPLWHYISLTQHGVPARATTETVRRGVKSLWHSLPGVAQPTDAEATQTDLSPVPQHILEEAARAPDWQEAVPALGAALTEWLAAAPAAVRLVVGAPYSGTAQVATGWARAQQWPIIDAPTPAQIVGGGEAWLATLKQYQTASFVLPRLEGR